MNHYNLNDHGIYITQLDSNILPLFDDLAYYSQLLLTKSRGQNIDYRNGSYLRHQRNVQEIVARGNDLNVSRIYKIDLIYSWLHDILTPYLLESDINSYYGSVYHHSISWFQYNLPCHNCSTRGPHVDYPGYRSQIKYILYLDDVSIDHGPFCHFIGSNTIESYRRIRHHYDSTGLTDIPSSIISEMGWSPLDCIGGKGSLILSDVGAVHFGKPQLDKTRRILMGSLFPYPITQNIGL